MSYLIKVTYSCLDKSDITFSDVLTPDDWTCANYWNDIGDTISSLIAYSDNVLSKVFPHGHCYQLSNVNVVYLEDDEE